MAAFKHTLSLFVPFALTTLVMFGGCTSGSDESVTATDADSKYSTAYEGMTLYAQDMPYSAYKLSGMDDAAFNALPAAQQLYVADKLLATLYYGIPDDELEALIASGIFISSVREMIASDQNDLAQAEARLNDNGDDGEFSFSDWPSGAAETAKILARFYVLPYLDKNYVQYWSAYVLASSIMFSPAFELESSHNPNIERIYSALVRAQREEYSLGYSTFLHMISDDNWRRFRSPEDNGREMMEIFLKDFDDTHVPLAGKALQNWHLDRDNDTLVVGLDENRDPVALFGTTVFNGYDFYRELAKSPAFVPAVIARLADVYFPTFSKAEKSSIVDAIIKSDPQTWQDILLQIVFSKSYLLDSDKPKSAEAVFFSLSKKLHFTHQQNFFSYFAGALNDMNQAAMKYKLGKSVAVPLDSQSFITYHKFIREKVMMRYRTKWSSGWETEALLPDTLFEGISAYEYEALLERLVDHIFLSSVARYPDEQELAFFKEKMLKEDGTPGSGFRIFRDDGKLDERRNAAVTVLDYLSRLTELYQYTKVAS